LGSFFGFTVGLWLLVGSCGLGLFGLSLGFLLGYCVDFLVYLEAYCAFFDIYIITYKKKKKKFMPNLQTKPSWCVPISQEDVLFPVAYTGEAAPWDFCI
jgi:hypothetical protein